jgi:hypothetical protein
MARKTIEEKMSKCLYYGYEEAFITLITLKSSGLSICNDTGFEHPKRWCVFNDYHSITSSRKDGEFMINIKPKSLKFPVNFA